MEEKLANTSSRSKDTVSQDQKNVGYSLSDISCLEQIEGVMTDLIGMRLSRSTGIPKLRPLSHHLVEEEKPQGEVRDGMYVAW